MPFYRRLGEYEADTEHERTLRAVDPRWNDPRQAPRMAMLNDEPPNCFELGSGLDSFLDPDED